MSGWKLTQDEVVLEKAGFAAPDGCASPRTIRHLFEDRERHAINAALAAGRPLLVRGEPGVGKSQLAAAAAVGLGRRFVSKVIDARTESGDLFFTLDAVRRLAEAQLVAHGATGPDSEDAGERMEERNFITPGPLWWGLSWQSAYQQADRAGQLSENTEAEAPNGVVVLLDEMDKADSSVPNGLLECLGNRRFPGPGGESIACSAAAPLVVVTTNEERALPDAFLRRCLVLQLGLPESESELSTWLMRRGRAHFTPQELTDGVIEETASMLMEDRQAARRRNLSPPGGAEFLDLLRALVHLEEEPDGQLKLLSQLREFTLRKHPEETL